MAIAQTKVIKSVDRNNFSASSAVTDTGPKDITFVFDTSELLEAVPLVFGQSQDVTEREITSHFPVDLRAARAVFPSYIIRKHSQRERYYYQGYKLDPNKLIDTP